jgi:hypothetical protein
MLEGRFRPSARHETEESDPIQPLGTARSGPKAGFICYDINDELLCERDCKNMITTVSQDDYLSYFVVVHGVDIETYERLAIHFECRRGGIRVTDESRYISIPVTMATLGDALAWITTELGGRYHELYLIVCVATKLSWNEVVIDPEIALLAGKAGAAIKVAFKRA